MEKTRIIVGVDEAGRGPVLGPLVLAALAFEEEDIKKLEWLGVKDSKLLSSQVREELFERIHEIVHDFRIEVVEPEAIDLSVNDPDTNLNWLEAETTARLVSELQPDKIILDCPSPNTAAYRDYVLQRLSEGLKNTTEVLAEHKADVNHLVVGAASIIAKVIRDRHIDKLKAEIGIDFGSGYLTDPKTQDFLKKHNKTYAHLFRKSWQSYKDILDDEQQKRLGEF